MAGPFSVFLLAALFNFGITQEPNMKVVWEDCGSENRAIRFKSFEMGLPEFPGPLNFYVDAESNDALITFQSLPNLTGDCGG